MRPFSKLMMVIAAATLLASCGKGGGPGGGTGDEIGMGKAGAPVKLIEYGSASCTHCGDFNNEVLPELTKKYIDTGVVHYELREVTTPPHNFAAAAFLTARCAGKDKYYAVLDANYRKLRETLTTQDYAGALKGIALSSGLSEAKWQQCVEDEAAQKSLAARVEKHNKEAEIDGTPTFYINGKKYTGAYSVADMSAAIEAAKAGK